MLFKRQEEIERASTESNEVISERFIYNITCSESHHESRESHSEVRDGKRKLIRQSTVIYQSDLRPPPSVLAVSAHGTDSDANERSRDLIPSDISRRNSIYYYYNTKSMIKRENETELSNPLRMNPRVVRSLLQLR